MAGATMGTAPLKDDYQMLERRLVNKMQTKPVPAPRPPVSPRIRRLAQQGIRRPRGT